MGWWKVNGTESVVGGGPLDTLATAVAAVLDDYRRGFGRAPTRAEWAALLTAALGANGEARLVADDGTVTRVVVE